MGKSGRLIVAPTLAWLLLFAFAPAASAECFPGDVPLEADQHLTIGDAFLATVTESSADVDPNPDGAAYDRHIELAVETKYWGSAPKTLSFNSWEGGTCGEFLGEALQTGDEIIIAVEDLRPRYQPGEPFEGHMVVWHKTSDGWSFFAEALAYGADPQYYAMAARDATTKAEILQVISSAAQPQTSTDLDPRHPMQPNWTLITAMAFALGFALGLHRFWFPRTLGTAE